MKGLCRFVMVLGVVMPLSLAIGAEVQFRRHELNSESAFSACAVMDVNHDGRLDVVCGDSWYEAKADGSWATHFVGEVEMIRGRNDGYSHLPFDVDGDGWMDVINVNYRSASMYWVRHPGALLEEEWTKHTIALPGPMETGRLVDVDGDGRLDILPNGVKFAAWWEIGELEVVGGMTKRQFVRHDLPSEVAGHGVGFGDVNGDGRGDVVGPTGWLEAPEDRRGGEWVWHADFVMERPSIPILVVDVDGDGDSDLVWGSAHDYGIFWMEQEGGDWRRREIDTSWSQGHALLWADFDGDGREELVSGKRYMAHDGKDPGAFDPLVIFRYDFDRDKGVWERFDVSRGGTVGFGLDPKAEDMDGDGDLDLVVSGRSGLYLLENLLKNPKGS